MTFSFYSGEKSSSSSSDGRNINRSLGGIEKIARKIPGRKMDMIFNADQMEYGCLECGRFNNLNSTKELMDGSFKLPVVMKEMFVNLCNASPTLINDLHVVAFMILGILH